MFKAPVGLSSFKFEPLTPRSADAFLTPRSAPAMPSVLWFITGKLFPVSTPCCCSSCVAPASAFQRSPRLTSSPRVSRVTPPPPSPLVALLPAKPPRLQAAPWNPNGACRTLGGVPLHNLPAPMFPIAFRLIEVCTIISSLCDFRLEIASETEGLMTLCADWEPKVEDESIPEESEWAGCVPTPWCP